MGKKFPTISIIIVILLEGRICVNFIIYYCVGISFPTEYNKIKNSICLNENAKNNISLNQPYRVFGFVSKISNFNPKTPYRKKQDSILNNSSRKEL